MLTQMEHYEWYPLHINTELESNQQSVFYCEEGEMLQLHQPVAPEVIEYPNTQPKVHPALIGMSSFDYLSLNAGFQECADETIRYLVEEEHYSPDDPCIIGLQKHLKEQQKMYCLQQMFRHYVMGHSSESDNLDDSGVSLSIQSIVGDEDSNMSSDEDLQRDKHNIQDDLIDTKVMDQGTTDSESNVNITNSGDLDMNAIMSIAEEIMSLLDEDEVPLDTEDTEYYAEQ